MMDFFVIMIVSVEIICVIILSYKAQLIQVLGHGRLNSPSPTVTFSDRGLESSLAPLQAGLQTNVAHGRIDPLHNTSSFEW